MIGFRRRGTCGTDSVFTELVGMAIACAITVTHTPIDASRVRDDESLAARPEPRLLGRCYGIGNEIGRH